MKPCYWITLDVHSRSIQFLVATPGGRIREEGELPTALPAIVEAVDRTPRPRRVVLEEGPLSGWLSRGLAEAADAVTVCDPRRNRLVSDDGDKSDELDCRKLLELARLGNLRVVHQAPTQARACFKQHVAIYHDLVGQRVRQANRVIWQFRRFGVVVTEKAFADPARREAILMRLPTTRIARGDACLLLTAYDQAVTLETLQRRRLVRRGQKIEAVRRLTQLPGIKWIRAATLVAYLDTPFRFHSKQALWRYLGIGLERRQSGSGPVRLGPPRRCHRLLKSVILGAAKSAIAQGNNPFADCYQEQLELGHTPRIARRTAARLMATTAWGMWKGRSDYQPCRVRNPNQPHRPRKGAAATDAA